MPITGNQRRIILWSIVPVVCVLLITVGWVRAEAEQAEDESLSSFGTLQAHILAYGIPGAGAVAEVGDFLRGSPLHDRAAFAVLTQPGQVLDPKRILVASTSNFGAPLARPNDPEGSVLSIDAQAEWLAVPPQFAAAGGQASALNGAVQVYAAQSPAFLNSVTEPQAVTAALPSVSLPLGISLNNGNGRPWIANAPNGAEGEGTITVLDPQGYPLAGAPDPIAGGVFAGNSTNRSSSSSSGLTSAALARSDRARCLRSGAGRRQRSAGERFEGCRSACSRRNGDSSYPCRSCIGRIDSA